MDGVADAQSHGTRPSSHRMILLYTFCNFFNQFSYGLGTNLIGPALVDLQYVYRTTIDAMSLVATFQALGYLLGSLVALIIHRLNRQLTITLLLVLQATTLALIPNARNIGRLYLVALAYGIGGGTWDASSTYWLCQMWPNTNAAFMQFSQFSFGVGMISGPLLVSGFVHGEPKNASSWDGHPITPEERRMSLTYPFSIASAVQFIVPLILAISFVIRPYRPRTLRSYLDENESDTDLENSEDREELLANEQRPSQRSSWPQSLIHRRDSIPPVIVESISDTTRLLDDRENISLVPWRGTKLVLAAFTIGSYGAFENSLFSFYATALQYLEVGLSANEAASLLSLVAVTYAIGRLLGAFLVLRITPDALLVVHYATIFLALGTLYFGRDSRAVLHFGSLLLGLSFSAIWPAIFALTDRHMILSDAICSAYSFLSGGFTLFVPLVLGERLKRHPIVLFYILAVCISLSAVAFALLEALVFWKPRKQHHNRP